MKPRHPDPPAPGIRPILALSMLALVLLPGCGERAFAESTANAAPSVQADPAAGPAVEDLARFGRSVAARSAGLELELLGVRNGIDPDEHGDWSVFFLSFAAARPSGLQLTGNLNAPTLSPENQLRHDRWQARVCTSELRAIMREHGIDVVYASFGKADMPMADCRQAED